MNLYLALLIIVVLFLLIVKLIAAWIGRMSERFLTSYFVSLKALVEHDKLPTAWSDRIERMARSKVVRYQFRVVPWQEAGKAYLLRKLAQLRKFFETSPFVEKGETREVLLAQLDSLKDRWEIAELSDILNDYELSLDPQETRAGIDLH